MSASFFFYDLETSGFSASEARIMQFAGQRTDSKLVPIGDPVNVFVKLASDVLPDPDAVLLTGITPQQTLSEGLTEAEFLDYFYKDVVQPQTTFLGFNSVRFDDEFMRYTHYRNFYDPYEWQWTDDCSRWDVLDLVRMTRALRPEGIEWPVTVEGKATNRLELLTKANGLNHERAHDALSDVYATIAVAKLIKDKQPELFDYLLKSRNKKVVKDLVLAGQPFTYTSGRFPSETLHTTAVVLLAKHPQQDLGYVFDLRYDPTPFAAMSIDELVTAGRFSRDPDVVRLPVKELKYNRCPAVAPLGVMNTPEIEARLGLSISDVKSNYAKFKAVQTQLAQNVLQAQAVLDTERQEYIAQSSQNSTVDGRLYDGFIDKGDKAIMYAVRKSPPTDLLDLTPKLSDERLKELLPLYKARNYPKTLSSEERAAWEVHCSERLFTGGVDSRLAKYFARLSELASEPEPSTDKSYLLEELKLYGESIVPSDPTA